MQASPEPAGSSGELAPTADEYLVPANKTAWHLDRIDQRRLPLDGDYSAQNTGEGVTVYLLSSGVLATHEEFWDPVLQRSRALPLWGVGGAVCHPLRDYTCQDLVS